MSRYLITLTVILFMSACNGTGNDDHNRLQQAGQHPGGESIHTETQDQKGVAGRQHRPAEALHTNQTALDRTGQVQQQSGESQQTVDSQQAVENQQSVIESPNLTYYTRYGHVDFMCQSFGTIGVFQGRTKYLNGKIDFSDNSLEFTIDLLTLKTGIAKRDRDMYQTLNSDRHPDARFTGTFEPGYDHSSLEKQPVTATGTFTLNGVEQDLVVQGTLLNTGTDVVLEAEWIMNVADYNIIPPAMFDVKIGEELEIQLQAGLAPRLLATTP